MCVWGGGGERRLVMFYENKMGFSFQEHPCPFLIRTEFWLHRTGRNEWKRAEITYSVGANRYFTTNIVVSPRDLCHAGFTISCRSGHNLFLNIRPSYLLCVSWQKNLALLLCMWTSAIFDFMQDCISGCLGGKGSHLSNRLMVATGQVQLTFRGMPQGAETVGRQPKFMSGVCGKSPGPISYWNKF